MRIVIGDIIECVPCTFSWNTITSCCFVMRLFWVIVTKSNKEASTIVTQHVSYLLGSILSIFIRFYTSISSPQANESKVCCISVRSPLDQVRLTSISLWDIHCIVTEVLKISFIFILPSDLIE